MASGKVLEWQRSQEKTGTKSTGSGPPAMPEAQQVGPQRKRGAGLTQG